MQVLATVTERGLGWARDPISVYGEGVHGGLARRFSRTRECGDSPASPKAVGGLTK